MKTRWLDRRIAWPGPYLTLCLSQAEYLAALKHLDLISADDTWCGEDAGKTHYASNPKGETTCLVCVSPGANRSGVEIAGLLVHEAVHVWQRYCDCIGERRPGVEQEAYGVQSIAQELMAEYARRIGTKKARRSGPKTLGNC
jgi:hypothetical protein